MLLSQIDFKISIRIISILIKYRIFDDDNITIVITRVAARNM